MTRRSLYQSLIMIPKFLMPTIRAMILLTISTFLYLIIRQQSNRKFLPTLKNTIKSRLLHIRIFAKFTI
jgi:hypothetical protein